jgi:hypothetical protein
MEKYFRTSNGLYDKITMSFSSAPNAKCDLLYSHEYIVTLVILRLASALDAERSRQYL